MSIHYSKFDLNTYKGSEYFKAHVPENYPLEQTLQSCRAFRRLPSRLRELSVLAKKWTCKHSTFPAGIEDIELWYDDDGNELDAYTNKKLTDEQLNKEWDALELSGLDDFKVEDIPLPAGGFADPETWEPKEEPEEEDEYDGPTEEQISKEVKSGRERAMKYYGIEPKDAKDAKSADALAWLIYLRISRPRNAPASS